MKRRYTERKSHSLQRKIKRRRNIQVGEIEKIINEIQAKKERYTTEEEFLIKYFNMKAEDIPSEDFGFANLPNETFGIHEISDDKLQVIRYKELMKLELIAYQIFNQYFTGEQKESDTFHDKIRKIEQYKEIGSDIEKNPIQVKKMRNLQLVNRIAHNYNSIMKKIIYAKVPRINSYRENERNKIKHYIEKLFSKNEEEAIKAKETLGKYFKENEINELLENKSIKFCSHIVRWMFNEKDRYILEITKDLQNENDGYKYGTKKDKNNGDMLIFDVPGYGQFSVHFGKNREKMLEIIKEDCGVGKFEGIDLEQIIYILRRPNVEKIKQAEGTHMKIKDKYFYNLLTQNPYENPKKIREEKIKKENKIEDMIKKCKNPEKSRRIYRLLKRRGIKLENITFEVLERGNKEILPEILQLVREENIDLSKCKGILAVSENQLINIYGVLLTLDTLGIDKSILQETPNFLKRAKPEKIEPIYRILQEYKIKLTNRNLGDAFCGYEENIEKNLDLVIENGLYDLAQNGVSRFFTMKNDNLNMRMNLLETHGTKLTKETADAKKRKINGKLFKSEKNLMKEYGIEKREILDRLSEKRGQELIKENPYIKLLKSKDKPIEYKRQKMARDIYRKIESAETRRGIVLQLGDYYYSARKVKKQINKIIANIDSDEIKKENEIEILKAALFANKNITDKEVKGVSKMLIRYEEKADKNDNKGTEYKESRNNEKLKEMRRKVQEINEKIEMVDKMYAIASETLKAKLKELNKKKAKLERKIEILEANRGE